uniref:Sulfatase domain-containing protein n=1 Tax=Gongylonema pulchrum TaxID=637853 RepID=A0A183E8S7_9BILA
LIVFGDDFTDDGIEFGENSHGFLRNSNGPVWSEYLSRMLSCEKYTNYAHTGARSGYDNVHFSGWSGILWQMEYHFINHPTTQPHSLIILQAGGVAELLHRNENLDDNSHDDRQIDENVAHSALALIDNVDDGIIVVMNLIDPCEAPGYASFANDEHDTLDVSTRVSKINSKLWKLVLTEGRTNPRVGLFDLNAAIVEATRRMNITTPFAHQRANLTSREIYNYAYHDQWYPSTFVHHKIAEKLIKFLEDL